MVKKKKRVWAASPAAMLDRCARPRRRGANGVLVPYWLWSRTLQHTWPPQSPGRPLAAQHSALSTRLQHWLIHCKTASSSFRFAPSLKAPTRFRLHYLIYRMWFLFFTNKMTFRVEHSDGQWNVLHRPIFANPFYTPCNLNYNSKIISSFCEWFDYYRGVSNVGLSRSK